MDVSLEHTAFLFESLANLIPYPYYVSGQIEHDSNKQKGAVALKQGLSSRAVKGLRRPDCKKSRYDPLNWMCTTYVISAQPQVKRPTVAGKLSSSVPQKQGLKPSSASLSREDILKRLHNKIETLKQQKRHTKKRHAVSQTATAGETQPDEAPMLNPVLPNPVRSQLEKPHTKRRRLIEAMREVEKKEKVRANWTAEERREAELREAKDSALLRASGERVYDNVKRLKKALKSRAKKQPNRQPKRKNNTK